MRILITAGGTTEKIDEVRHITNQSTGSLGRAIAEAFLRYRQVEKIIYICGKNAVLPDTLDRVEVKRILNVEDLQNAVLQTLAEQTVDGIVHCMAVSDYAVSAVTTTPVVRQKMQEKLAALDKADPEFDRKAAELAGTCLLEKNDLAGSGKISSDMEDLIILMRKTPKIIGLFHELQPGAVLVGFKLLNHVPAETLLEAGFALMRKNRCDFVFANDLAELSPGEHKGYFLEPDGTCARLTGREQIAKRIASDVIRKAEQRGG